jgi:DNA polymerase I-like protein with 3'-5' exonuclease and polymerase domains
LSGHRRHAPVDYTQLINAPIQADETIIVLSSHIALTRLDPELYTPCMEIHDDLTFHLPERGLDERIDVILREMTKVRFDWIDPIPLEVELAVGDDWDGLKDRGKFKNRPDGKPGYIEIGGH